MSWETEMAEIRANIEEIHKRHPGRREHQVVFQQAQLEDLAFDCGRREQQVVFLRTEIEAALAQLTGRKPGGQRLAISGATAILRKAMSVSLSWDYRQ